MSDYTSRSNYETYAQNCLYGKKPQCSVKCPLNLDIPKFAGYLKEGNFTSAYKLFQTQAVFPNIVVNICPQPCKNACVRQQLDEGVCLLELEKACIKYSNTTDPVKYSLPKKNKKIAVIGAGLTGLSCALKLGSKNYYVTVYEKTDKLGGRLWELMDPEIFLPEIEKQFKAARCEFVFNKEIKSLEELEFDAAFIATGKGGNNFGLKEGVNTDSFGTKLDGVFIGGSIFDTSPVMDIAMGIVAAYSIEKYIKTGLMDGMPETFIEKQCEIDVALERVKKAKAVKPSSNNGYTQEEAIAEAQRCLECNCTKCSDGCELFGYFGDPPKTMVANAIASIHTKQSFAGQHATRTMASCNLCGLCKVVCPKDIDMGKFFDDFRHFKREDDMFPAAFHDFFIRDMKFSNDEAYLVKSAPGTDKAGYMFFPGCQLGASDPDYITKTYGYLLDKIPDTAIILGCCGAPSDWAAEKSLHTETIEKLKADWESLGKPKIIFACPTCKHQFEKFLPEAAGVSLYDIIIEKGLPKECLKLNMDACVFDPCSSRYDKSMQKSVREISKAAGINLTELYYSNEKAQCCGWGGHIQKANPDLFKTIVKNRISAAELPYIAYCTNCRDTFAFKGKDTKHILDIIFGLDKADYRPPSLGQRRTNRLVAKRNLLN